MRCWSQGRRRVRRGRGSTVCRRIFGWNDLGSWASLHEHLSESDTDNVLDGPTNGLVAIESEGNYVYAPGKMVALLGVDGLVVVETEDALLITTRGPLAGCEQSSKAGACGVGAGRFDLRTVVSD